MVQENTKVNRTRWLYLGGEKNRKRGHEKTTERNGRVPRKEVLPNGVTQGKNTEVRCAVPLGGESHKAIIWVKKMVEGGEQSISYPSKVYNPQKSKFARWTPRAEGGGGGNGKGKKTCDQKWGGWVQKSPQVLR